jgi:hypothetical protein
VRKTTIQRFSATDSEARAKALNRLPLCWKMGNLPCDWSLLVDHLYS